MGERQLHLNAFLMSTGHHEASWRLPESDPFAATSVAHYVNAARVAERGTFDSLFLADGPQLNGDVGRRPLGVLEPLTLLTVLAGVTERIGLIATASTSCQLALQSRSPVCLPRSRQRRPRRVEHRHQCHPGSRPQLRFGGVA